MTKSSGVRGPRDDSGGQCPRQPRHQGVEVGAAPEVEVGGTGLLGPLLRDTRHPLPRPRCPTAGQDLFHDAERTLSLRDRPVSNLRLSHIATLRARHCAGGSEQENVPAQAIEGRRVLRLPPNLPYLCIPSL